MAGESADPVPLRETFESFYLREISAMTSLAYAVCHNHLIAEDIAQEAMLRAFRRWDRIAAYDNPATWTRRVTINLATSVLRRRALAARVRLRLGTAPHVPAPEATDDSIWQAVRRLPRQQRAAIALFYLEDRSVHDIAQIMDCSEATARVHLHRGRQALARSLGERDADG